MDRIKDLISNNQIEQVLNELEVQSKRFAPPLRDQIILLKQRYHRSRSDFDAGQISLEAANIEENRIAKTILRMIEEQAPQDKRYYVPSLPPHALPREKQLSWAVNFFQTQDKPGPKVLGIFGMAGQGKSTLATFVARDAALDSHFEGGIFWVSFGQQPDVYARQKDILSVLNLDGIKHRTPESLRMELHKAQKVNRTLLIIDDAWKAEHVEAFTLLNEATYLLVTTRDSALLRKLDATILEIDDLSEEQAMQLLSNWSGYRKAKMPPIAQTILAKCSYSPLAISIIGGLIKYRRKSFAYIEELLDKAKHLATGRMFANYPYPNINSAILASIQLLDARQQQLYYSLVVFPEDALIPNEVLAHYWQEEPFDTEDILDSWVELSLLKPGQDGTVYLHDLLFDFVQTTTPKQKELHQQFYDRLLVNFLFDRLDYDSTLEKIAKGLLLNQKVKSEQEAMPPAIKTYLSSQLIHHICSTIDDQALASLVKNYRLLLKLYKFYRGNPEIGLREMIDRLPQSVIESDKKIQHIRQHPKEFLECIDLTDFLTRKGDPATTCKHCQSPGIIHGHIDLGHLDFYDNYYSICPNCFWCWHVEDYAMYGYEDPQWEFSYETNTYRPG